MHVVHGMHRMNVHAVRDLTCNAAHVRPDRGNVDFDIPTELVHGWRPVLIEECQLVVTPLVVERFVTLERC